MANPQKEKGYTPVANEIIEHLIRLPLNGTQWRIIVLVWRYTYGFNRKEHGLSESFIAKALTINKRNIRREISQLIEQNILTVVKEATFTSPRVIRFNKNYDTWERANSPPVGKVDTEGENTQTPEGELAQTPEGEFTPQENKYKTKYKTKNEHEHFFESVWNLYPYKKGKGQVSDTQKAKLWKIGFDELARCIERYKKDKPEWKQWQHGSTFFNSGYVDYLDKNYQPLETPADRIKKSHPEGFEVIR